jgi:Recombination endonuclease VII
MGRPRKFTDTEKWCPDCVAMLPHASFYKNAANKSDGLAPYCKKHFDDRRRAKLLASPKQQAAKKIRDQRYRDRHQTRINIKHKCWTHGLTPEQYKQMYDEQNGLCAFSGCLNPAEDIDHDHETMIVRKLICHKHNMALGLFGDDPKMLREAADYVESFKVNANGKF